MSSALYAVDIIDDKHNDRVAASETTLSQEDAERLALSLWKDGKNTQVLAWTREDGYTVVANYQ